MDQTIWSKNADLNNHIIKLKFLKFNQKKLVDITNNKYLFCQ